MKILVAPGSLKGTMKSDAVSEVISRTLARALPSVEISTLPLADGGEGTVELFRDQFGAKIERIRALDAYGGDLSARLCVLLSGDVLIESSEIIGLSLAGNSRKTPLFGSSRGIGLAIKVAIERGAQRIFVTMGDSATMDLGLGMLHELGAKFFSTDGSEVEPIICNILYINRIDFSGLYVIAERVKFIGLVDTDDCLTGEIGQVQLYGAQKGLLREQIPFLEKCYSHMAQLIESHTRIKILTKVRATGSGGLAASLHAGLGAELYNTLEYLSESKNYDAIFRSADIAITSEGCLDNQTRFGKVPHFVAKSRKGPTIALVGNFTDEGYVDFVRWSDGNDVIKLINGNPGQAMQEIVEGSVLQMIQRKNW